VRIESGAQVGLEMESFLNQFRGADDRAGEHVGVSVEILGGAMDHKIEAQRERLKIHGRGEGAVDHGNEIVLSAELHRFLESRDASERVADRFQVEELGIFSQPVSPRVRVASVHELVLDAPFPQVFGQKGESAPVQSVLNQDVVAGLKLAHQAGRNRGHSAGCDQRRITFLDGAKLPVQFQMIGAFVEAKVAQILIAGLALRFEICRAEDR